MESLMKSPGKSNSTKLLTERILKHTFSIIHLLIGEGITEAATEETTGNKRGKNLLTDRIVKHAFAIIQLLTGKTFFPNLEKLGDKEASDTKDILNGIAKSNPGAKEASDTKDILNEIEKSNPGANEPSDSQDIFSMIAEANIGSTQLMHQGDIAIKPGRSATKCPTCIWPRSSTGSVIVPYNLSSDYNAEQISLFKSAMQEFETLTCVRFVPWTTEKDFINIKSESGCWSYVGRLGGAQSVSLSKGGCMQRGIIQHELNHVLGFFHEQCRSDRDNYVSIMTQYIAPENLGNFVKYDTNNLGLEYDYTSVMHYPKYAFSNTSGEATILPKPDASVAIGQRDGLSILDISKINRLYQCGVCGTLLSTINGTMTSANYPSAYPNNANCVWLIRTPSGQVSLKFDAFDVQSSPDCVSDYIKIYDGPSKTSPVLLDRTCGTGQVPLMIASTNQMLVEFASDAAVTATGYKATYSSVQCGGAFYAPTHNFTSPGYPTGYYPNLDCSWIITAPAGYKVSLNISDFYLELEMSCRYDYLQIYDGDKTTSQLMRKYCGSVTVTILVSTGNSMLLKFHSDYSVELRGFQASYTLVPPS
ncbi:embryonic protein UVS.2-like isoform X2 [Ascaphus truei]